MLFEIIQEIEEKLSGIGAKSVDIGVEDGISADDTPFIRIVPSEEEQGEFGRSDFGFEVHIGTDIKDELRNTYQEHIAFLEKVKSVLAYAQFGGGICYYQSVQFDKDLVKNFKVSVLTFTIKGIG